MSRNAAALSSNPSNLTISFFGHFGSTNFGNEATLIACLSNLQRLLPGADFRCICTHPEKVAAAYKISSTPINRPRTKRWMPKSRVGRIVGFAVFGIPYEISRWYDAYTALKGTDLLIVPGTGLLTDAFGILLSWGPYNLLKWSLMAKLRGCGVYFISVGAGPLTSRIGKSFVKWATGLADFRSFRDSSSIEYMNSIGFRRIGDPVCPDLAFSLPMGVDARENPATTEGQLTVGIGIMLGSSMYGYVPDTLAYQGYLESVTALIKHLVKRGHHIQLLIGEDGDLVPEFQCLLNERLTSSEAEHVKSVPATSFEEVTRQIANTDFVIATRFHNVLFALLASKPTISISFHHKCKSLMSSMNLSEYCMDLAELSADILIDKAIAIETNFDRLSLLIKTHNELFRNVLEEQYQMIARNASDRQRAKKIASSRLAVGS